ncbi:hypothetical protein [Kosakonia cowanii]|uniref:hypothetical protein n=1 Tax=Kosakonia cowanii TaxID=208223 RepID=UPI0028AF8D21|nr:hypothetical protein [Kosakonia cowanii]
MQICWPWIFGKRRHSGEMRNKSQLMRPIFLSLLRHCLLLQGLRDKKEDKQSGENACAGRKLYLSHGREEKPDQMVKIYILETKNDS